MQVGATDFKHRSRRFPGGPLTLTRIPLPTAEAALLPRSTAVCVPTHGAA